MAIGLSIGGVSRHTWENGKQMKMQQILIHSANDDDDAAPKAEARSSLMMTLVMDNDLMEHPEHSAGAALQ